MANSGNYKRILTILEKWPVDETKIGRDLGVFLKNTVRKSHKEGKLGENQKYWDRQYIALQRIVNSDHLKKYPRTLASSATGLTAEQCNLALSNEFLEQIDKEEQFCSTQVLENYIPTNPHIPVMLHEVLQYLKPTANQTILDMTFGAGGHSRKILESDCNIKLLALDRDPVAHTYIEILKKDFPGQVTPLLGKFSDLPKLMYEANLSYNSIDGILCDFGCSSMQFDEAKRGFSLSKDGPLDMRMDASHCPNSLTAADVLAKASEEDLAKILKIYGEEKQAKKIARAIVESRYLFRSLDTTGELADLVDSVCSGQRVDKLQRKAHNATKTFQALRIFVNNELNEINYGLILAHKYLKIGGRIVTITFHSLEDTIVKRHLLGNLIENMPNSLPLKYSNYDASETKDTITRIMESNWKCLHKHVIIPKDEEIESNPRSRSAKLRAAVKVK